MPAIRRHDTSRNGSPWVAGTMVSNTFLPRSTIPGRTAGSKRHWPQGWIKLVSRANSNTHNGFEMSHVFVSAKCGIGQFDLKGIFRKLLGHYPAIVNQLLGVALA